MAKQRASRTPRGVSTHHLCPETGQSLAPDFTITNEHATAPTVISGAQKTGGVTMMTVVTVGYPLERKRYLVLAETAGI